MPTGLNNILKNLNKEIRAIEGRTLTGVRKSAIFIQGESQEIVPQRFGVLINSAFTDSEMTNKGPVARVGYTAKYAPYVHEMPDSNHFTKPGTMAKFLQRPISENHLNILKIIRDNAKIK
jgi:hypothetical protein